MKKLFSLAVFAVLVLIPVTAGLYVRFDDGKVWKAHKERFYFGNRPLFTSYDAFFFARYAREEIEGTYRPGKRDPLRFVPDNFLTDNITYPSTVPMESYVTAKLAKLFKTSIENVAYYLSPVLAVLFAVPFVLYFYRVGFPVAGFGGALLGCVSLLYLIRTSICRFDTDSLNLFFPFTAAYLLFETYKTESRKMRILLLIFSGITLQLFNWWYAHAGLILVIFLAYLVYILALKKLKPSKEDWLNLGLLFVFSNPLTIIHGIFGLYGNVYSYVYRYFHPAVEGGFPNVQMSIGELKHFNLKLLAETAAGNELILIVGFASFLFLLLKAWRQVILIVPVFLMGLLSFKGANRFSMYLSPFIGAGIGFLVDVLILIFKEKGFLGDLREKAAVVLFAVLLTPVFILSNDRSLKFVAFPKITPGLAATFSKLKELTPRNSWIWTWWDYGYAIQYYSNRGVFHDGGSQYSPKTYFVATTFSTASPKVAYNAILAVANLGASGIEKLLKEGKRAQEVRDAIFSGKFSKPLRNPVYWVFTSDEFGKFGWINYFGTWDFNLKRGRRGLLKPLKKCIVIENNVLNCDNLIFDLNRGEILVSQRKIPLKLLVYREKDGLKEKSYHKSGLILEFINDKNPKMAFLEDEQTYRSMFNQMYILRNYDRRYFELVLDWFPTSVVYKVKTSTNSPR